MQIRAPVCWVRVLQRRRRGGEIHGRSRSRNIQRAYEVKVSDDWIVESLCFHTAGILEARRLLPRAS